MSQSPSSTVVEQKQNTGIEESSSISDHVKQTAFIKAKCEAHFAKAYILLHLCRNSKIDLAGITFTSCTATEETSATVTKESVRWQMEIESSLTPKQVLEYLVPRYPIPDSMTDEIAIQLILDLCSEKRTREKLPNYNTFDDAVELFKKSKNILVLTGAGVSVSCGIPDFRSVNGIYARLHKDFPELPDPQSMFDIDFFRKNPAPFYNFAKEIFPGQFQPSVSHMFIKFLEESGKLLRNYTQNIDTLEKVAGIERVIECHGSFSKATCLQCKNEVDSEEIKEDVMAKKVAYCKKCDAGVVKPNIVFFGEDLGDKFHIQMSEDRDKIDLLVVIGSSLKVQPVALIPFNIDPDVPQILINRERLTRYEADIKLLGNCDDIIIALSMAIGGEIQQKMMQELLSRPTQFAHILNKLSQLKSPAIQSNQTIQQPFEPRNMSVEDFKQILSNEENARAEASDEPASKRLKRDTGNEPPPNQLAALWESNYVLVESKLPPNTTLLVPPNINVFKGAELYYERDNDTFCRSIGSRYRSAMDEDGENDVHQIRTYSDSSASCSSSSSSTQEYTDSQQSGNDNERGGSCPPNTRYFPQLDNDQHEILKHKLTKEEGIWMEKMTRATSCPESDREGEFYRDMDESNAKDES
ncbi:sir2 family domain-containing protein [Ditylenchus destructor]|nr:sir2 family domain-containing protein [Ditylenchus destructor]